MSLLFSQPLPVAKRTLRMFPPLFRLHAHILNLSSQVKCLRQPHRSVAAGCHRQFYFRSFTSNRFSSPCAHSMPPSKKSYPLTALLAPVRPSHQSPLTVLPQPLKLFPGLGVFALFPVYSPLPICRVPLSPLVEALLLIPGLWSPPLASPFSLPSCNFSLKSRYCLSGSFGPLRAFCLKPPTCFLS